MKKSHQKLLMIELIMLVLLIINSFVTKYLSTYGVVFFLFIVLGLFYWLLGFEKDRHRYIKDFILDEFIILIIFLLSYYFLGIFIGFLRTDFLNLNSFYKFVLPSILYILLREFIRYLMIVKSEGNNYTLVFSIIIFILLDITNNIYLANINSKYSLFIFITTIVIPAIFNNVIFTYLTKKVGYKPTIFYCLFMELYSFVIPIVPNANEYLKAILSVVMPTILCYHTNSFFESIKQKEVNSKYIKKKRPLLSVGIASVMVLLLVYFTSGYFDHWAVVVASNSMKNTISKGDIVVIDKINNNYDQIKEGQILAYRYNNKIIIHRVVEVMEVNNNYYFKTKGDANIDVDNVVIDEKMVVGVVNIKIPYIGLPTVWLKNL